MKMKQIIYVAFLFLILTNISFAGLATNPYLNGGTLQESYSWTNPPSSFRPNENTLTPYIIQYNNVSDADNVKCWVRFVFNSVVANNSKTSRWVLTGHNANGVLDIQDLTAGAVGSIFSSLPDKGYFFNAYIGDINSTPNFNSLCNNSDNILIYFYGGTSDDYALIGSTDMYPTQISNLKSSMINNYYMCLNTTSDEYNYSLVDVTNPLQGKSTYINVEVACGRELLVNQWSPIQVGNNIDCSLGLCAHVFPYITPQSYILSGLDNKTIQLIYGLPPLPQDLGSQITRGLGSIVTGVISFLVNGSTTFVRMMPEPVPSIIKMVSVVVDFFFISIILFVMYKVAVAFLSFRKSLKSSLTKATIIFMQLMIFLFIAISMYYLLSQTFTYCATKSGLTMFGLRQIGVELAIPKSITDIPAIAWDVLYVGVINSAVPECQQYYASLTNSQIHVSTTMPLVCDTTIPLDINKPCQSLIIRSTTAFLILFIITIILGIIWTLSMHLFNRVQSFSNKVRGPDYEEVEEIE